MKISDNGLNFLKELEGFSPKPYFCSAGVSTIGHGHVILSTEKFNIISEEDAMSLLLGDTEKAGNCIKKAVTVQLNQNQFDALVCFVFNIGCQAFKKSTLLKILNTGDYFYAAGQFQRWIFSKSHPIDGLITRRDKERALFLKK
jgi:lysozyme